MKSIKNQIIIIDYSFIGAPKHSLYVMARHGENCGGTVALLLRKLWWGGFHHY
jgi:hypothetical protein